MKGRKLKTSVSLYEETLAGLAALAAQQKRSVSYLIEELAEKILESSHVAEESPDYSSGKPVSKVDAAPAVAGSAHKVIYPHISTTTTRKPQRRAKSSG